MVRGKKVKEGWSGLNNKISGSLVLWGGESSCGGCSTLLVGGVRR